jgi:hypothetical protein
MAELYRHFDADGNLLYVGASLRSMARLSEHSSAPWFASITRVTVERFNTRDDALRAERQAIAQENPRHNIKHQQLALSRSRGMTATEYRSALKQLGLTQVGAGKLLGVNPVSSRRWAATGVTGTAELLLRLLLAGKVTPSDLEECNNSLPE